MNMMPLICSRPAWGRLQAREALGIELPKPNMNTQAVMEQYVLSLTGDSAILGIVVDDIKEGIRSLPPAFPKGALEEVLRGVWARHKDELKDFPEEFQAAKGIIIDVQGRLLGNSNGRNVLLQKLFTSAAEHINP